MTHQDIEESFKNKTSNDFYRYYFCNESSKQTINCWSQLIHFYYDVFLEQEASEWLFRGDIALSDENRSMKDAFKTSLDKAFEEFDISPETSSGQNKTYRNKIEDKITRSFRRRAFLLTGSKESTQSQLENLSLLRHHGAPARILDWMYSFFTAVYFAVNRNDKNQKYVVWSLNRKFVNYISERLEDKFLKDKIYIEEHFKKQIEQLKYDRKWRNNLFQNYLITYIMNKNPTPFIYAANPYHLNERLVAQRGTLLFAGTVDKTWGKNLLDTIKSLRSWPPKNIKGVKPIIWEICIELNKEERKDFLKKLDEMNINQATLFPDLDGFAESLRTRIAHPESLGVTE